MLIVRIVGLAVALSLGVLVVLYMVSRDRRYLRAARAVFTVALGFALVFLLFLAFEQVVGLL